MADECLEEVNERTSTVIAVAFLDEDGAAVVPSSATYRIDRPERRTNIQPATTIGALNSTISLLITSEQNNILRNRSPFEIQEVTVEFDYTGTLGPMHGTMNFRYKIINLYGVVDVASPSTSPSASASPST